MLSSDVVLYAAVAGGVLLAWTIYGVIYRLYLSPLARFPGPKIAALTRWYECYYDVFAPGGGMYMWEIEKMHQKYGPVVRINPDELHFNDLDFYDTIYASAPQKRDRYGYHAKAPDSKHATGFTLDHDVHKKRREALAPFFSKRNLATLEPEIKMKVEKLCERIDEHYKEQQPVNLTVASLALSIDILTSNFFAEDYGLLSQSDFNEKWRDTILSIMQALHATCHFGWLVQIVRALPDSIAKLIAPDVSQLIEWKEDIKTQIKDVLSHRGLYSKPRAKKTIFEELRDSEKLPPAEKSLVRLTDECAVILIAGSESPAKILALILYHLMVNPDKLQRLRTEIATVMPNNAELPAAAQLETLPYLAAVINEGLRLHSGIVSRSQRIAREPIPYKEFMIPAGTPMSSSSYFTHYNETIFPRPRAFLPERWLEAKDEGGSLKPYLVAFGRGTRSCLGYNLGTQMLYLTIAALASRYTMTPFETDNRDVDLERDWTVPQPKADTQGVRAMVVERL